MSNNTEGLYEKYEVRKDGEVVEDCFVLEPKEDPAARAALYEYIQYTENEKLSKELSEWLDENYVEAWE